ncbi:MAG: pirin family protein [Pseudomonadota bacterium]|nr:pirin family protein [Pseudomonadota bacterium]
MKNLAFIQRNDTHFAVGDFSPVLSVFSYHDLGSTVSPFLLLDHIGPGQLLPSNKRQGVNKHPHRGFETVTLVYAGALEHQDSSGAGGIIQAGDVQWMTAGSGVIHEELFSEAFTQQGGRFEMIQLWVNLPASAKMTMPRYQHLSHQTMPQVELADHTGRVRVVAGEFAGVGGAADTHTRINVLDVHLTTGQSINIHTEAGDTALIYVRKGKLQVGDTDDAFVDAQAMAVMSNHGTTLAVTAHADSWFLVLTGQPLSEPINGHGPFVMNTYDEILQAYADIKSGNFG